jgi:hypothetical protein
MTETKTVRIFVRNYSLLKCKRLRATIKVNDHTAHIRSLTAYAWPEWEFWTEIT